MCLCEWETRKERKEKTERGMTGYVDESGLKMTRMAEALKSEKESNKGRKKGWTVVGSLDLDFAFQQIPAMKFHPV
jgi:hypothetical protein